MKKQSTKNSLFKLKYYIRKGITSIAILHCGYAKRTKICMNKNTKNTRINYCFFKILFGLICLFQSAISVSVIPNEGIGQLRLVIHDRQVTGPQYFDKHSARHRDAAAVVQQRIKRERQYDKKEKECSKRTKIQDSSVY